MFVRTSAPLSATRPSLRLASATRQRHIGTHDLISQTRQHKRDYGVKLGATWLLAAYVKNVS